jgi:hypothetical protein
VQCSGGRRQPWAGGDVLPLHPVWQQDESEKRRDERQDDAKRLLVGLVLLYDLLFHQQVPRTRRRMVRLVTLVRGDPRADGTIRATVGQSTQLQAQKLKKESQSRAALFAAGGAIDSAR